MAGFARIRVLFVAALISAWCAPAMAACRVAVGELQLQDGDIESTSVVKGSDAQAVVNNDTEDALHAMADKLNNEPVMIRVGSHQDSLPLANNVLDEDRLTILGKNTSEALILQQELKRCL
jgi:hypothetical protein